MYCNCCLCVWWVKERTANAGWRCASRCTSASPRFEHADHQPFTSRQYHSGCSHQISGPIDSRACAELHWKLHWKVPMSRIGGSFFRQTAISVIILLCSCAARRRLVAQCLRKRLAEARTALDIGWPSDVAGTNDSGPYPSLEHFIPSDA